MSAFEFYNPVAEATDPSLVTHDGKYYLIGTSFDAPELRIQVADSIGRLGGAEPVVAYRYEWDDIGVQMWSPSLHEWRGRWFIYLSVTDASRTRWTNYVLESTTDTPLGPYEIKAPLSVSEIDLPTALDPLPRTSREQSMAASLNKHKMVGPGLLELPSGELFLTTTTYGFYIQRMENPWTPVGPQVCIQDGTADFAWEGSTLECARAFVHTHAGATRVFMPYSSENYVADRTSGPPGWCWSVGLFVNDTGDVMDPRAWRKLERPAFHGGLSSGYFQVLALDTFASPDGAENWAVYNALDVASRGFGDRDTFIQPFTFDEAGYPEFGDPVPVSRPIRVPSGDAGAAASLAPGAQLLHVDFEGNTADVLDADLPWTSQEQRLGPSTLQAGGNYGWDDYRIDAELPLEWSDGVLNLIGRMDRGDRGYSFHLDPATRRWTLSAGTKELDSGECPADGPLLTKVSLVMNNTLVTVVAEVDGRAIVLTSVHDKTIDAGLVAVSGPVTRLIATKLRPTWGDYTGPGWTGLAINAGGPTTGRFQEDLDTDAPPYPYISNKVGGTAVAGTWSVDIGSGPGYAPQELYETYREGEVFHHVIAALERGTEYSVRFHLAERLFTQPGQRLFRILINEQAHFPDVDMVDMAGLLQATTLETTATASPTGHLLITYETCNGAPASVCGVEVLP